MKIYLDKLPKSCLQCPCCALSKSEPKYIEEWDWLHCNPLKQGMRWKPHTRLKLKDCPLIPLKKHTEEVNKKVCEEIKKEIKDKLTYSDNRVDCPFNDGYPDEDTICSVIDQYMLDKNT